MGPLLYALYTNEMSTVIRDKDCLNPIHLETKKLFGKQCNLCGNLTTYADDASYHIASKMRIQNLEKLNKNLDKLGDFMTANDLTINKDKTNLIEVMIKQKRGRMPADPPPPELTVINKNNTIEIVKISEHVRILGLNIKNNLTWSSHLEDGKKPLLPSLRKCLGALKNAGKNDPMWIQKHPSKRPNFKQIILSDKYLGGATPNLIRKAQSIQNMAARWVTKSPRRTRISTLLETTGWFSILELSSLSSATLLWKTVNMKTPRKLHDNLTWDSTTLKFTLKNARIDFSKSNFTYRACNEWNSIPDHIRTLKNISRFKTQMKKWTKERRPKMPD